jgi:hypothetical protein
MGEQVQSLMGMSFLPMFAQTFVSKLGEAGIGVARAVLTYGGGPSLLTGADSPAIAEMARAAHEAFDRNITGLPTNPIERAGYESAFPWVARTLGDVGAFAATAAATSGLGEAAGVPRILAAARGARGLVAINAAGAVGGGLIAAALAPDDHKAAAIMEGVAVGLGGTALLSSLLAGRPIGTPARLLKIQAMAETLEAAGVGGALRVAPRLTFGRMAMAGIEGAGYSTLTAMGQGEPVDKAIGQGVDEGLMFAGYDTAFIGLGRMARWLPIHARIAETWAKTAVALKVPSRLARALGDTANAGVQAGPGAMLGGLIGGPIGAAIGGAASAAKALELQTELATTAARLRSTGAIDIETINHLLTGQWNKLSAEQAESVTKALTKDVVERATADLQDPVLKYAINEAMGGDPIIDNTELRALATERGRVTQSISQMRSQGILEIDPQMIQATRRLAELAERRNQVLLDEVNALGIGRAPSTHTGVMGRVSEKVVNQHMRAMIEGASSNKTLAFMGEHGVSNLAPAQDRLAQSARALEAAAAKTVKGATEGVPTRVLFRENSTILRDLADSHLEGAGINAQLSSEGARTLDRLMSTPRQLTGRAIEGQRQRLVNGQWVTPGAAQLPGRGAAPAGTKLLKAPRFVDFNFEGEGGAIGGALSRQLGGAALGGATGAVVDDESPLRGAFLGAAAGALGASAGERLLAQAAKARRAVESAPRAVERRAATRASIPVSEMSAEQRAIEEAYSRARVSRTKLDKDLIKTVQSMRQSGATEADIERAITDAGARPRDYTPLYGRATMATEGLAEPTATARTIAEGYTFKPAGEIPRKGKEPIRYFISNKDMPDGGGRAGSKTTEEVIRRNGLDPFARASEAGRARGGALGVLGTGAIGALVVPAVAKQLGLLDEEDSVLTASAIGFAVAAGLGFKLLARDGALFDAAAQCTARFVQPSINESIPAADIARLVGKTGDDFKTTIDGHQVGGRRLYWALPQRDQVNHTVATLDAWPQRTTLKGKPIDLPERRKLFERDLARFAPFTVTEQDWGKITDSFMASTQALGYTKADQMRLYKGWLGWMTTPLEQRARTDIAGMSLDRLGRDAHNPFTSAAGIDELRSRAVLADTITGPSQPLPRNYRRASNSLNKDGTPAAGRIRALVDDIEANVPSAAEGTADTLQPWWSAPGARGIAPTVRFYRYADRITQAGDPVGQLVHNVTNGIFQATELARVADDTDRKVIASIFRGINSPHDMDLVRRAVEDSAVRDAMRGTNPRVFEAAIGVRKFLADRAEQLGLPQMQRIEDYFPWVYNYRTKRELMEMARRGEAPSDINYPIDAPVPRHVFFNHLESRVAETPLGQQLSPLESLLMYAHGANRKIALDQLLANFGPETFGRIRTTQPWIAHDLGRWLLDVVGVPGPGTMYVQRKAESMGLFLEKFPMFQRAGLAQEINERYFLSPSSANNLSRLATGWAYTSKIAWNMLSAMTNMSQMIINGGTEYGLLNVLTSSVIGAGVAGGERIPILAPVLDAITPLGARYRKLLTERGILSETSQRHFDTIAMYEASFGSNRAHLIFTGAMAGAAAGAAGTSLLNADRENDDQLSVAGGALAGASVATLGAAKSAIMRRALMRVRDLGTFPFNLVETWNRSTIGVASLRQAALTERALKSPSLMARVRVQEKVEGVITGALGGAAAANFLGADPATGAVLGGAGAAVASPFGESRTARTARTLATIRSGQPIFENRLIRDQARTALRPLTDDEVGTLYAQMQTDITQFRIAKEGRGYFLNTPHGQALGALQSYTLNQAEFIGGRLQSFLETANRAIAGQPVQIDFRIFRAASFILGVGSVYGALIGGSADGESDPDYWVSRLGFGIMPLLHWNDTARKWEILSPTDMFKGPLIGDIMRTSNSYMKLMQSEDANASFLDTTDALVLNMFPGAKNIEKARRASEGAATLKLLQEGAIESVRPMQPVAPRGR